MNHEKFVQLSNGSCPISRLGLGPIADKFFIVGAIASVIGIGWMGVHMWLAQNGHLAVSPSYAALRRLHILVQVYLFLGLFSLGFIAQAGPKLVGAQLSASPLTLLWLPLTLLGVFLWHFGTEPIVGQCIVSLVFCSALFYAARCHRSGIGEFRRTTSGFLLAGLFAFAVSPFCWIETPAGALFFLWSSIVTLIVGSGQQFIAAFLNGRRCSEKQADVLLAAVLLNTGLLFAGARSGSAFTWHLAGAIASLSIGYYVSSTRLFASFFLVGKDALALSFLLSYAWAIVGGLILLVRGGAVVDLVFHLWAAGWAAPLIFTVSAQIMGFMSGKNITKTGSFVAAVLLWQVVPLARGVLPLLHWRPSAPFFWMVSVCASAVLLYWCTQLMLAERVMWARFKLMRELNLPKEQFGERV